MIFVTVGNAKHSFARLVDAIHELSESGGWDGEEIVVQHGHTTVAAARFAAIPFMSHAEFDEHVQRADVIISHGGCGTLRSCLKAGKIPVVVPRRKQYREHVNDHQLQLATELAKQGRAILCEDLTRLRDSVEVCRSMKPLVLPEASELPDLVRVALIDAITRRTSPS